tara:strand:- start:582 stop:1061 length:480 start_codon:yes stop_codon:yes gene_type:complete
MSLDVKIIETNDGGDAVLKGRDLEAAFGWANMVYLSMFGGNLEQNTPTERVAGSQEFDWWGNNLFFNEEPTRQFNSLTERRLMNVPLNSRGRVSIEQAIKEDLSFISQLADVDISTAIQGPDRLRIEIVIREFESGTSDELSFLWDGVEASLTVTPTDN